MKTYKFTITGTVQVEEVKEDKTFSVEHGQYADRVLKHLKEHGQSSNSELYTLCCSYLRTDEFAEVMKFLVLSQQVIETLDANYGIVYRAIQRKSS